MKSAIVAGRCLSQARAPLAYNAPLQGRLGSRGGENPIEEGPDSSGQDSG